MLDKSSEAYGEKGYKWGSHLFYTPGMKYRRSTIACKIASVGSVTTVQMALLCAV
jgi:hypothetical protein